ncbi:MAG: hypothetical protein ACLRRH_04035 [Clostridium sp.]
MKKGKLFLKLYNIEGILIDKLEIVDLKVNEEYIINISKSQYDNDEPCIIIRTSVIGEVYNKFNKFLKEKMKEGTNRIKISELPNEFKESLCFEKYIYEMHVEKY